MTHNSELIVDSEGVEILVGYNYEKTAAYLQEPGNAATLVDSSVYTELTTVEVIISGSGIDILPIMTEKQKVEIIKLLQYE